ncbi:MAG: 30S ribosomal protein S17e [bacterium]|nr:30S ribosomal protein S17e [bacterium]
MGRIKTQLVKRTTQQLMDRHGTEMTADFDKNKELVSKFLKTSSKKTRNVIAGYATRLVNLKKKKD